MAKRRNEIEAGTGNVFADLGYADAKERTLKVELALEVNCRNECRNGMNE